MEISAVLTNFDCARFLPEALASVFAQDAAPIETVVVDDGSRDGSREAARPWEDRVRWVDVPHGGQALALNAALPLCRGEWVAFLETDDVWTPGKLRAVADAVRAEPDLVAVQHGLRQADERLRPKPTALPARPLRWTLEDFLAGRTLLTGMSGLAVRRDALESLLPLPAELITCVDEYLQPRLLDLGPMRHLPGSLGLRRVHGANHYAGVRVDARRLEAYLRLKDANKRLREDFLSSRGMTLDAARRLRERRERAELELFRHRLDGRWSGAWAALREAVASCGSALHALFKASTLLVALASPGAYLLLQSAYERVRIALARERM